MLLFRPTFIIAQFITCFAFVCMFARTVSAIPTPQFGFSWRHTLEAKLPMNKAISASESASASATSTLAEADINSSALVSAPAAAVTATQSSAPYDPGDTSAQAQASGATSLARLGAAQVSMGAAAFVLVYFVA
ncbi:hypothetical protein FIBSPDRAFT_953253 [Athelia psychrophila]|uniref:Uncharacterized protein n=1 Tax=Athelia psychrophila TaxID=1759441 RepID=A0A166KHI9_9AGAM|nr:hypothetical protein FIBSPDRAFT_953253 [Fibularhizoctonia sp. CBS 109695]